MVQAIGSTTPVSNSTNSSTADAISILEKQRELLENQLQKVQDSKQDDETKQKKIKEIQDQIKEIDQQIQQKKAEEIKEATRTPSAEPKEQEQSKTLPQNSDKNSSDTSIEDLIVANRSVEHAQKIHSIKNALSSEKQILKTEVKLDENRGNPVLKEEQIQKIDSKEKELTENIRKEIRKAQQAYGKKQSDETQTASNQMNSAKAGQKAAKKASSSSQAEETSDSSNSKKQSNEAGGFDITL